MGFTLSSFLWMSFFHRGPTLRIHGPWKIECFLEDLFLGSQWSIILGYRRLSVKFSLWSLLFSLLFSDFSFILSIFSFVLSFNLFPFSFSIFTSFFQKICGSPRITGSWIPRAPMKGFCWHLHVGSSRSPLSHLMDRFFISVSLWW